MEENVSPELYLALEPEQSQDPMDSSSQAIPEDDKVQKDRVDKKDQEHGDNATEEKLEESAKTTSEFKRTCGFRRTTIAKREMPGDTTAESQDGQVGPVRRSGRQAKRTDKLEEFLLTTKRARTVGRRSAPGSIEGGDPPSQTHTDAETASEASFDGNTEAKSVEDKLDSPVRKTSRKRTTRKAKGRGSCRGGSVSDDGSSDNEEKGSGDAPKEPHPQEEKEDKKTIIPEKKEEEDTVQPQPEQDSVKKEVSEKEEEGEEDEKEENEKEESEEKPVETSGRHASRSSSPAKEANRGTNPNKRGTKSRGGAKTRKDKEEEDKNEDDDEYPLSSSSSDSGDAEGYDPNALYCICRQKHNKRFMICCDRCEEWFHGDCVGITEARGRLMERNGEDYVCPNCTTKKSQTAKPNGKPKAAVPGSRKAEQSPSVAASSPTAAAGADEKGGDDLGIKGRIEKTTNPSGKKKIKIFQAAAEESNLPKCIGPGCEKNALKDSVYCGSECILRHAAAAMAAKSISEHKQKDDPKQKDQDNAKGQKKTPVTRATPKKNSTTGRKTSKKSTEEEESDGEADEDGDEESHEEHPPPPTMSSWSSDHNYNAVTPEKTTPIAPPTVLNKTCMYLFEGLNNPLLTVYLLTL